MLVRPSHPLDLDKDGDDVADVVCATATHLTDSTLTDDDNDKAALITSRPEDTAALEFAFSNPLYQHTNKDFLVPACSPIGDAAV